MKFYHFWVASVAFYYIAKQDLVNRISDDLDIEGYYLKKQAFKKMLDSSPLDKLIPFIYPLNIVRAFIRGMNYLENQEEIYDILKQEDLVEEIEEYDIGEAINEEMLQIDRSKVQRLNINLYNMSIRIKRGEYLTINSDTVFDLTQNVFDELEIFEPKEAKRKEFFNGRNHLVITVPNDISLDLEATTNKGNIEIENVNIEKAKLKTKNGIIKIYSSIPTESIIKKRGILNREVYCLDQGDSKEKWKFKNGVESIDLQADYVHFETETGKNAVTYEKKRKSK